MLTLVGRHHAPSIMHDNYDDDMRDDTASTELETCTYVHTTTCARATKDNHMIYDDCNWKLSLFAALCSSIMAYVSVGQSPHTTDPSMNQTSSLQHLRGDIPKDD